MIGAVVLTFIITALSMLVLFLMDANRRREAEKNAIVRENNGLKRQISEHDDQEHQRRERFAYDRGLYDGRATDTLYRQCLKKYASREQTGIMMDGEERTK